jgi:hypothetical protein
MYLLGRKSREDYIIELEVKESSYDGDDTEVSLNLSRSSPEIETRPGD